MGLPSPSEEDTFDYGLYLLDIILQESGHFLDEFDGMPLPQQDWSVQVDNPFIREQLDYNREAEQHRANTNYALMETNPEQQQAFVKILESVEKQSGKLFFLSGPGGTGKTFVYKTICNAVRARGWIVLCVASTGIAALLLAGGRTAHSMFKIPIDGLTAESFCNIPKQSQRADLIRCTRLII
ncbi:PIF1-like helicase-domain-containing protein, partial [Lentinula edodes]|uniref:PIF1-like helicase-domain-containing protein n=1 Tax=Lentinula edodes TaxID=5353 RepID=UPI001E8D5CE5